MNIGHNREKEESHPLIPEKKDFGKIIPFPLRVPCNPQKIKELFRSLFSGEDK